MFLSIFYILYVFKTHSVSIQTCQISSIQCYVWQKSTIFSNKLEVYVGGNEILNSILFSYPSGGLL